MKHDSHDRREFGKRRRVLGGYVPEEVRAARSKAAQNDRIKTKAGWCAVQALALVLLAPRAGTEGS